MSDTSAKKPVADEPITEDHEFDHGPGIDEAPLNDLDDGEAGLDPNILDDDLLEDGMGLG